MFISFLQVNNKGKSVNDKLGLVFFIDMYIIRDPAYICKK